MRKILVLTGVLATLSAVAMASATPVTTFSADTAKVSAEYSFSQNVTGFGGGQDGFGASLEKGLTDRWAVQYSYHKTSLPGSDLDNQQLNAIYKHNDNINLFGGVTYVDVASNYFGYQIGAIGHKPLTDNIDGFAKVSLGNDLKYSMQVGSSYALQDNLDLNLYYEYNRYDVGRYDGKDRGLHVGLGYSF